MAAVSYLNNPKDICNYTITVENRTESVVEAVRRVIPAWSGALTSDVDVRALTGGITNTMYLLTWNNEEKVIVRLFGKNTEVLINRDTENSLFAALSGLDMGCPTFFGLFTNGRVEGYLNARSITPKEMREPYVYLRVGAAAGRFHTRGSTIGPDIISHQNRMHFPGSGQFMQYLALAKDVVCRAEGTKREKLQSLNLDTVEKEVLWLTSWLKTQGADSRAHELNLPHVDSVQHSVFIPAAMLLDDVNHKRLARFLAYQEVLCHHDLLSGNIMITKELEEAVQSGNDFKDSEGILFIDYEYSAFTYRAFDLGNFFCEFAGFDTSIEESYPDTAIRQAVIMKYFDACALEYAQCSLDSSCVEARIWQYWRGLRTHSSSESATAIACFIREFETCANQLTLCAHMLWFLWGIVQSEISNVDFDYIDYVRVRLEGYRYHKKCFHSQA